MVPNKQWKHWFVFVGKQFTYNRCPNIERQKPVGKLVEKRKTFNIENVLIYIGAPQVAIRLTPEVCPIHHYFR